MPRIIDNLVHMNGKNNEVRQHDKFFTLSHRLKLID